MDLKVSKFYSWPALATAEFINAFSATDNGAITNADGTSFWNGVMIANPNINKVQDQVLMQILSKVQMEQLQQEELKYILLSQQA
jgi:hypothetical protein